MSRRMMLCLHIKKTLSRYPCSTEIVIVRCVSLRAGHAALHKHTVNGTGTGYGRCGSTCELIDANTNYKGPSRSA